MTDNTDSLWLFGYGSLIWLPDFPYRERRAARIFGWARRFWQGSHDHRGLPNAPGRVATLIRDPHAYCDGVAYLIAGAAAESVVDRLDYREKNGYRRHHVEIMLGNAQRVDGIVYIAAEDNHAFLGAAPVDRIARQILCSAGPSGRNVDYLYELARALRVLGVQDDHVFALESAARSLGADDSDPCDSDESRSLGAGPGC